jgi:hypothetical protein
MGATYNAGQIIGKDLFAKQSNLGFFNYPLSKKTYKINSGDRIGRVYSYVIPKGQTDLYWVFYTKDDPKLGTPFYVKHRTAAFDVKALKDAGALTVKEQTELINAEAEKERKGEFIYYLEKYALPVGGAIIGTIIIVSVIKNHK